MDNIVIKGIAGYDGEYPFDASYFTNKELHTIKRLAGVRAGEIQASFMAGDNDLIVAFAAIALERNGKVLHEDVLWNANVGCIQFIAASPEADVDPPAPGLDENESAKRQPSGETSADDSESPANGQNRIGLQASELSAT